MLTNCDIFILLLDQNQICWQICMSIHMVELTMSTAFCSVNTHAVKLLDRKVFTTHPITERRRR
jgi:hypothetical protein